MSLAIAYPTDPPKDVPRGQEGIWRCGFCATGHHGSCPGAVRAKPRGTDPKNQRLIKCHCCKRDAYCLDCYETDPQQVNPETWCCYDRLSCRSRVESRLTNDAVYRMIQQCKVSAVNARRRQRETAERIRQELDPDEIDEFDRPLELRSPKASKQPRECECGCGAMTKGGRFAIGHDAKLKSRLKKAVRQDGDMEALEELERRKWIRSNEFEQELKKLRAGGSR